MNFVTPFSFVLSLMAYHRLGPSLPVVLVVISAGLFLDILRHTTLGIHAALLFLMLMVYQWLSHTSRLRSIVYAVVGMLYSLVDGLSRFGTDPAILPFLGWSAVWLAIGWFLIRRTNQRGVRSR